MFSALKIGFLAAAASLAGSAALAGSAPAAYYPSLGYGQDYAVGYDEGPQGDYSDARGEDYGPPPGYVGDPAYGPSEDYPPADAYGARGENGYGDARGYEHSDARGYDQRDARDYGDDRRGSSSYSADRYASSGYGAQTYGAYSSRSEQQYGYDSGWRGGSDAHVGYGPGSRDLYRVYHGGEQAYAGGGEHAYVGGSVSQYDYNSGWHETHGQAPLTCPYEHERRDYAEAPPHRMCPSVREQSYGYSEHLPDSFFADAGGVGPDYINEGGGGGASA